MSKVIVLVWLIVSDSVALKDAESSIVDVFVRLNPMRAVLLSVTSLESVKVIVLVELFDSECSRDSVRDGDVDTVNELS